MNRKQSCFVLILLTLALLAHAADGQRWKVATTGVLQDNETGLQWTQEDNGRDIDFNSAQLYCAGSTWAGGNWRLPTTDELTALHDAKMKVRCGKDSAGNNTSCEASPLFTLSSQGFWAAQSASYNSVGLFLLPSNQNPNTSERMRVLCVRGAAKGSSTSSSSSQAAAPAERWSVSTPGVLRDSKSGLEWTQEDNRQDIDWNSALQYCERTTWAGGGWRLPNTNELTGIYDPKAKGFYCGALHSREDPCHISPLFKLTGLAFWTRVSKEINGNSDAAIVNLSNGLDSLPPIDVSEGYRVLCVRRP